MMNKTNAGNETKYQEKMTEAPGREPAALKKAEQKPGTRMVSLLFIVVAAVFFWESIGIYQDDPSLSGSSTFPLIVSGFLLILGVADLIQNIRKGSATTGMGIGEKCKSIVQYLLPKNALVFLLMTVVYYVMLEFGVGFVISSLIFLLAAMCYLIPKNFVKNLIYTGVCIGALYLIFKVLFKVFLP
ncbi:tripartite tricarboxylate transporter TctB family protein [Hominifimenecus sp. rT4P-3]|uniref:tripartite tricarboxylate transporter TctB family protein n=1 Tax=Hominifimenecus sp. rT4P-3 TaxID=3242979 RepID=UPI003DA691AF